MRLLGEVVAMPFEVRHTDEKLNELARFTLKLKGETKVVMGCAGTYHEPIVYVLHEVGR